MNKELLLNKYLGRLVSLDEVDLPLLYLELTLEEQTYLFPLFTKLRAIQHFVPVQNLTPSDKFPVLFRY